MFGKNKKSAPARTEPTAEAKALLEQAAKDYASGWGANDMDRADKDAEHRGHLIQAQRSANRRFGSAPQPSGDE